MKILPMEPRHTAQIAALERLCFSAPWSEDSVRSELDNPLSLWLVAEENGEVAGYIGSQTVLGEADMMNVAVAPACRRRGIAAALVEALIGALDAGGAYALTLEVRASNEPALALYRGLGFCEIGRRKNYYSKPREDALILKKQWKEAPAE